MSSITFQQFLRRYGIRMLPVSSENIHPGIVIQEEKQGFFKYDDLYKTFGQEEKDWAFRLQQANLVTGTLVRSISLSGRASMDEFGVTVEGGLGKTKRVNFRISGIHARTLTYRTRADIETAIAQLKRSDKARYKRYAKKIAIDQTFYADSFEAEFETEGNIDLRAEIADKVKVAGGAKIEWTSKRSFKIASNSAWSSPLNDWTN